MSSITEQSNPITSQIDQCNAQQILNLLQQVDMQMFATNDEYNMIHSNKVIQSIMKRGCGRIETLIKLVDESYRDNTTVKASVAFSGAGTSGRLSYFCANTYNESLSRVLRLKHGRRDSCNRIELFKYLVAGGYRALVAAQESAEDDPVMAVQDFTQAIKDEKHVVYVGITCGMSAPYVAGQLHHMIQHYSNYPESTSILLGFNPVEAARKLAIEKWPKTDEPKTFYSIAKDMEQAEGSMPDQFIILNPILGPEAVTGSTRMKGGSGTKLILDVMFATSLIHALSAVAYHEDEIIFRLLSGFQETIHYTYQFSDHHQQIATLINRAAHTLKHRASIYYIGANNAGMVGFIDASECPPTYGALFSDVRGYIVNGWKSVFGTAYEQKPDMEQYGEDYKIGLHDFERDVLPRLTENDTVIFLEIKDGSDQDIKPMVELANKIAEQKVATYVSWLSVSAIVGQTMFPLGETPSSGQVDHTLTSTIQVTDIRIPYLGLVPGLNGFAELSLKLVLNAITTGAHVLKGTTFGNRMINLRVSNNKLFYRAIGIISTIMKVDEQLATKCLLRSIYRTDDISVHEQEPISKHISTALQTDRVVPFAMLLASGCNIEEAENALQQQPVIRNAIEQIQRNL